MLAEALVLVEGLKLAGEAGLERVEVESDAFNLIQTLCSPVRPISHLGFILVYFDLYCSFFGGTSF